jgi:hypothetical protein
MFKNDIIKLSKKKKATWFGLLYMFVVIGDHFDLHDSESEEVGKNTGLQCHRYTNHVEFWYTQSCHMKTLGYFLEV